MALFLSILLAVTGCGSSSKPTKRAGGGGGGGSSGLVGGTQRGYATYYNEPQRTASGERFNKNALTAAHRTLPFGTHVRVTNAKNGKSVVVRINDRGPYGGNRIIDLSEAAAREIGMIAAGVVPVTLEVLK